MAGSTLEPISINQRMQTWFNFTHSGIMTNYKFDLQECIRHNKNWIDVISPETISFYNDYFVMNGKQYGRVMSGIRYNCRIGKNQFHELYYY